MRVTSFLCGNQALPYNCSMVKNESFDGFLKLEFWALTAVFVYSLLEVIAVAGTVEPGISLRHALIFLAFLYINFRVVPGLLERKAVIKRSFILIGTIVAIFVVFITTDRLFYQPSV